MSYRVINIYYSVMCYTNHINSTRIQSIASMALMVFPDENGITESRNSPTSESAATEKLASAKQDKEHLSTTQDLTQGTEDIDNGNIRRTEDPHTSLEALVQGISAKCAEMTSVVLKSALHKMQNQPQNSLPLIPRPPIEGGPSKCKQEVVESIMMAEHMNGMVEMAEPTKIMDIDRTALLGGEPAERACGVDEGDGTEHEGKLWLQETNLLCEEARQRNENTTENIPITNGLLLEGEWAVYLSGEMKNSNGDAGQEVKPADSLNESETLVTLSIESEDPHSGGVLRIRLGGTSCHVGDANHLGNQTDRSEGQADGSRALMDELRGQADVPSQSNNADTNVTDHGESVSTYLGIGDTKRVIHETYGIRSHADASPGQTDTLSFETDVNRSANATKKVRTA